MDQQTQVIVLAQAAAIGLTVIAGTLPTDDAHKNIRKVQKALALTAQQATTLIPALSALVVPDPKPSAYVVLAVVVWLIGVAIGQATPGCDGGWDAVVTDSCTKAQLATYNISQGLINTGVSLGVGALIAYVKTEYIE